MDLLQLQYVVTIAESASMTAAADKLFVSQSALSLSYRKLEQELGLSLFRKQGRRLQLTPAGEIFYKKAKAVLSAMAELQYAMQEQLAEQEQTIFVCTEAVDYTNEAVKLYSRICPDSYLQQIRGSTEEIRSMLRSGIVDFAVTLSSDFGPGTEATLLLDEPMLALVQDREEYEDRTEISLRDLENENLVTLREGLAINRLFASFQSLGKNCGKRLAEVNDPETIVIQVGTGFGFSFIPESVANLNALVQNTTVIGTRAIPITGAPCRRQVYLVTVKGKKMRNSTKAFLDFLISLGKYVQEKKCFPLYENLSELVP